MALALILAGAGAHTLLGGDTDVETALKEQKKTTQSLQKVVQHVATNEGITIDTLLGKGLKQPEELAGAGESNVTASRRKELQRSTVTIMRRPRNFPSYGARQTCTGTKLQKEKRTTY